MIGSCRLILISKVKEASFIWHEHTTIADAVMMAPVLRL